MRYIAAALLIYIVTIANTHTANAAKNPEDALLCSKYFQHYEQKYTLPRKILTALGTQESGKWSPILKKRTPWPWAFNAAGKGYYFDSKTEALLNVKKLKRRGIKSYDVGCMQVNMKYHPHAFKNISYAFDPKHNVEYAAKHLRELYDEKGSWRDAIASYHSGPAGLKTRRGREYARKIIKIWRSAIKEEDPSIIMHKASYTPISKRKPLHIAEQLRAYQLAHTKRSEFPTTLYD